MTYSQTTTRTKKKNCFDFKSVFIAGTAVHISFGLFLAYTDDSTTCNCVRPMRASVFGGLPLPSPILGCSFVRMCSLAAVCATAAATATLPPMLLLMGTEMDGWHSIHLQCTTYTRL